MSANERIALLRASMKKHGVNILIVPSSDPHMSEYLPDHWQSRKHFSGFSGSAGTLIVTETESGLWTDGRYFVQAARELGGSEIVLYRSGEKDVPTMTEFLSQKLSQGQVLGIDGSVTALSMVNQFEKVLAKAQATIRSVPCISETWEGRPSMPASEVYLHDVVYTGRSTKEKIADLQNALQNAGADSLVVSRLQSIAWLLNIRAMDIAHNPFPVSFCYVGQKNVVLFVNAARVPQEVKDDLAVNGVSLQDYSAIVSFVASIADKERMLVDKGGISYDIFHAIENNHNLSVVYGDEPILLMKSKKNPTEINNIKNAHRKDGCAMVRFQIQLEEKLAANETIREIDISKILVEERMKEDLCKGESFSTIAAYGPNAAMMHYKPTEENSAVIEKKGFLLVDSGAHYLDGTTDITRTYAVGPLTQRDKEFYTYVLQGHIHLSQAVFMEGCTGANLDILARYPMWRYGLDYRCGTGHGVGFFGGIHEGPQSMNKKNNVPFEEGMLITDEPGLYEENEIGIRIENELLCVPVIETKYGKFFGFEPVTYCPIDLTAVIPSLMSPEDILWIDQYHQLVLETLSPSLTEKEVAWLKHKTRPLAQW